MTGKLERVVVTGMGVVSPFGCVLEGFWENLVAGRSGVRSLEGSDFSGMATEIGAAVWDFDPSRYFSRKESKRMSRSSQFAMLAADQAIESARLNEGGVNAKEVGVLIGSSIGGYSASDPFYENYYLHGHVSPFTIPVSMNSGPGSNVSIKYGFQGPLMSVDAACATAAQSIGYAFNLIRSGVLQVAVTGAADSPFATGVVAAWSALRVLSSRDDCPAEACRPFSADRDGMVLGEGAGVLILESEKHALLRGAPILAELKGYGASADSNHLTQPTQEGQAMAMQRALIDAGMAAQEVDYINAHGTGTQWNDKNETKAIKEVFGEYAYQVPVVGNKAALGHSIAGSGALELIGCVLSIRDQLVPPTINYKVPDPDCDLDYVIAGKRSHPVRQVMSNSFAFGGSNAVLIVGAYDSEIT